MQDGGPSPAEHGGAEESAGMGARLLALADVAGSSGPTSSEQTARAAVGRGGGWGRVGRGAAGGEGWGRGANGWTKGPGAPGWARSGPRECSLRSLGLRVARFLVGLGRRGEDWLVPRPPAFPCPALPFPPPERSAPAAPERRPPSAFPVGRRRRRPWACAGAWRGGGMRTALRVFCGDSA